MLTARGGGTSKEKPGLDNHDSREPLRNGLDSTVCEPNLYQSDTLNISYVAMVQCLRCRMRIPVEVNADELRGLRSFERLRRHCEQCSQETEWQYLPLGVSR